LACLTLAACGRTPEQPPPAFPETGAQQVDIGVAEGLPQWLQIARQSDGGFIHWDRTSLIRRPGGEAEVWVQVRFGEPQLFESETETTTQAVRYEIERVHYRFKCMERTFAILERRFIGNEERILGAVPTDPVVFRAIPSNGAAAVLEPVACRGR
jgi:hypothetical protein